MKDLFVLTADLDAKVVLDAVLQRHHSLSIRPISFDVDRHTMRDAGMVGNGPELVRGRKGDYEKVLLLWDHQGSGWEKMKSEDCMAKIQERLDGVSWKDHSSAIVLVPELEEWLWTNESSVARHLGVSVFDLRLWIAEFAGKQKMTGEQVKRLLPKELFEFVFLDKVLRTISPRDFAEIAKRASLADWLTSESFSRLVSRLRKWFPAGERD